MPRTLRRKPLSLNTLALVAVASLAPAVAHADEPLEILFAPSLEAPVELGNVAFSSDFEPADAALQARMDVDLTLAVDLSLFGWAEYDWSEQTMTFDGFVGDDAVGEREVVIAGEWGAEYRFTDGENAPTTWMRFDDGLISFHQDWVENVGGVFLPNTPETTATIEVGVGGGYFSSTFDVGGGSPATGIEGLSYNFGVDGTWSGDVIEVALEPGGEPVAVFDGYQEVLELSLENPGLGGSVSVYATHRSTLSITRAEGLGRPSVDLETPYVDEFDTEFEFDFPLTLNLEIALPETEIVIPGVEVESGSTGGEPGTTGAGSSTGGEPEASTGFVGDTTGGLGTTGGSDNTGGTSTDSDPATDSSGGVGEGSSGDTTPAVDQSSSGCSCSTDRRSPGGLGLGLFLLGLGLRRRRSYSVG